MKLYSLKLNEASLNKQVTLHTKVFPCIVWEEYTGSEKMGTTYHNYIERGLTEGDPIGVAMTTHSDALTSLWLVGF